MSGSNNTLVSSADDANTLRIDALHYEILGKLHEYAHATGSVAGNDVIQWFDNQNDRRNKRSSELKRPARYVDLID